ncbi:10945_t:CDS:2, partial [Racocetra persica]
ESSDVVDDFCDKLLNEQELECVLPELKHELTYVEGTKKQATQEIIDIFETKPLSTECTPKKVLSINELPGYIVGKLTKICETVQSTTSGPVGVANHVNPEAKVSA